MLLTWWMAQLFNAAKRALEQRNGAIIEDRFGAEIYLRNV